MRSVVVRVVPIAERRLLGWIVGLAGGLYLIVPTMEPIHVLWPERFIAIGLTLMVWNVGMLLAWRPRPFIATARAERNTLVVEPKTRARWRARTVLVDDQVQVSVARAHRGFLIAVSREKTSGTSMKEPLLLEAETEPDARTLLAMLRVPWPGRGTIAIVHRREAVRIVQRGAAILGAIGGFLYFSMVGLLGDHDWKPVGLVGLVGLLSSVLYVLDGLLRQKTILGDASVGWRTRAFGALGTHIDLHTRSRVEENEASSTSEQAPRVRVFARGDETSRDWLARLDAMGAGAGYRGDPTSRDELCAIVDDPEADPLARIGAARVLVKTYAVPPASVLRRMPSALATRARVLTDGDAAMAAEAFDALGVEIEATNASSIRLGGA